jgi:hypothetical protein
MKFLLKLMRMGHTVMGITPPPPEKERTFLFLWIGAMVMVILIALGTVVLLAPHIVH